MVLYSATVQEQTAKRIDAFKAWVKSRIKYNVTGATTEQLFRAYAEWGYKKGAGRAYDDANQALARNPGSVVALVLRARASGQRGDTAAAQADFQTALTAHPNDPTVYRERGEWYLDQRQGAAAVADFQKALELTPNDPPLWLDLGRAYVSYGDNQDQPDKALEAFTHAIQIAPLFQRAYHDRGYVYLHYQGDFPRALADYDRAVQIGPGYAELYLDRAYCKSQMHDTAGELADLNSAIAAEPNNDYAYARRAEHYYYERQYDLALADASKAIELSGDYQAYRLGRSDLYLLLDEPQKAQADAQFVVDASPNDPAGHLALARALAEAHEFPAALDRVAQALKITEPSNQADGLAARGWIELRTDQPDQAAADFAAALKLAPYHRYALLGQGAARIAAQDYAAALPDIETGIGQDSRYGLGYILRAQAEAGPGQPVRAIADLQQAQRLILYPDERRLLENLFKQIKP